jgi:amino acid transporter
MRPAATEGEEGMAPPEGVVPPEEVAPDEQVQRDVQRLHELGYRQELSRTWSSFTNFAISFTIISVLAGTFTTFGTAYANGGPVVISIRWPVISALVLTVALSM